MTGDDDDDDDASAPADQSATQPETGDDVGDERDDDTADADAPVRELGQRTLAEHADELGLDDESATTTLTSDELGYSGSPAGAAESYEARLRRSKTSLLGRLDVALAWRQHSSEPRHSPAHHDDELWLLATWRR